jgi:hypothetical protein
MAISHMSQMTQRRFRALKVASERFPIMRQYAGEDSRVVNWPGMPIIALVLLAFVIRPICMNMSTICSVAICRVTAHVCVCVCVCVCACMYTVWEIQ